MHAYFFVTVLLLHNTAQYEVCPGFAISKFFLYLFKNSKNEIYRPILHKFFKLGSHECFYPTLISRGVLKEAGGFTSVPIIIFRISSGNLYRKFRFSFLFKTCNYMQAQLVISFSYQLITFLLDACFCRKRNNQ